MQFGLLHKLIFWVVMPLSFVCCINVICTNYIFRCSLQWHERDNRQIWIFLTMIRWGPMKIWVVRCICMAGTNKTFDFYIHAIKECMKFSFLPCTDIMRNNENLFVTCTDMVAINESFVCSLHWFVGQLWSFAWNLHRQISD